MQSHSLFNVHSTLFILCLHYKRFGGKPAGRPAFCCCRYVICIKTVIEAADGMRRAARRTRVYVYKRSAVKLTGIERAGGASAAGPGRAAESLTEQSAGRSRWPFARPVSRGLASGAPCAPHAEPGAASERTPRAPRRAPPTPTQCALQMLPAVGIRKNLQNPTTV